MFVVGSCPVWLKRHDIDYSMTAQFCATPSGGRGMSAILPLSGDERTCGEGPQSKHTGSATFDCDSIRKDFRTMVAEAKTLGFGLPLAEKSTIRRARRAGDAKD